jgi:hypothetical protein
MRFNAVVDKEPGPGSVQHVELENVNLRTLTDFVRFQSKVQGVPVRVKKSDLTGLGITVAAPSPLKHADEIVLDFDVFKNVQTNGGSNGSLFPPSEQLFSGGCCGNVISKLIYNTVTTFFVGEKIMIQVPTWFFPAGAGPYSEDGGTVTHGYPNPQATFRFAEPVVIETQQNFRVEIEVPESDVLKDLQKLYGPLFIWVVLDGYMTRDVQ